MFFRKKTVICVATAIALACWQTPHLSAQGPLRDIDAPSAVLAASAETSGTIAYFQPLDFSPSAGSAFSSGSSSSSAMQSDIIPTGISGPGAGTTFSYFARSFFSPRVLMEGALLAGMPKFVQAPAQPPAPAVLNATTGMAYSFAIENYSTAMDSWRSTNDGEVRYIGRRAAVGMLTAETRNALGNLILPLAFRVDPRYIAADVRYSFGQRLEHAVTSEFVMTTHGERRLPNIPKLASTFAASIIGAEYYSRPFHAPELNTTSFILKDAGYSIAGDIATNLARELFRSVAHTDLLNLAQRGDLTWDHYYPLTPQGKFTSWLQTTYGPRHFVSAILIGAFPRIYQEPVRPAALPINTLNELLAYDQVLENYSNNVVAWRQTSEETLRYNFHRAIGGFSESETQGFLQYFLLPVAFHQDGRYIPLGDAHTASERIGHAFGSLLFTVNDEGRRAFNISTLGGTAGAAVIAQQLYYPDLGVNSLTRNVVLEKTIGLNLIGDFLLNLIHESFPGKGL